MNEQDTTLFRSLMDADEELHLCCDRLGEDDLALDFVLCALGLSHREEDRE